MCFGKKPTTPAPLEISSPISVVHEKITFNLNGESYTPPYEPFEKKYTLRPIATVASSNWDSQDSQVSTRCTSPARPKKSMKWFKILKNKKLFQNAGLDSHGRLRLEYVDLTNADWGTPDEWNKEGSSSRL
ncbi:hypothetical protein MMC14_007701 [Varicellaria rhodocarpa]|nr:hypothetical protein [Varicellaria rhodocarpa]